MVHKYTEQQLDKGIYAAAPGGKPMPDFEKWRQDHADALNTLKHRAEQKSRCGSGATAVIEFGRYIMKSKTAKFATSIAAAVLVVFLITCWDRGTSTAWSVEQTIAAIEQLKTLQVKGTALWGPDSQPERVNFNFWVQSPGEDSPLKMRFECAKRIVVVRGNVAYECWPNEKIAKIKHGPGIADLKYWYKAAELSPWLTGKILKTMQRFTDDWKQIVDSDPVTGKEQVFVTCSYPPSNRSFFIVVDSKTKLIERAKLWTNLHQEGKPAIDAKTFIYNQEFPEALFEVPSGVTIVNEREQEESRALFNQGENLFHQQQKYADAIAVYQQVYDKFPDLNVAEEALMMIGICHGRLGQPDKAIEAFERAIREYPNLKGWIEATYFYLGCAYMDQGEKEKALEAFENCLAAGEGVRDPDEFPLKHARESINKIKSEQQR